MGPDEYHDGYPGTEEPGVTLAVYGVPAGLLTANAVVRRHARRAERAAEEEMLAEAKKAIPRETSPITDIRATAEYRAHMLEVMLERGIRAAVDRLNGAGPEYGERHI